MKESNMKMTNKRHSVARTSSFGHAIAVVAVSWLFTALNAGAVTGIISYQANANPTTVDADVTLPGNQFWTLSAFGAGPVGTGIVDGGTPAWAVHRGSVGIGEEFWTANPVAYVATGAVEGWKLSTRLRLPETGRDPSFGAMVDYADGSRAWVMQFGSDVDGDPIVRLFDGSAGPTYTNQAVGNVGYHDYVLAYNPLEANVDLYVDGGLAISDFVGPSAGFSRVLFGDAANSTADHDVNYNYVLWVAPEPSTVTLALAGVAALWMARRRLRA